MKNFSEYLVAVGVMLSLCLVASDEFANLVVESLGRLISWIANN
jgi:hypothetical protein